MEFIDKLKEFYLLQSKARQLDVDILNMFKSLNRTFTFKDKYFSEEVSGYNSKLDEISDYILDSRDLGDEYLYKSFKKSFEYIKSGCMLLTYKESMDYKRKSDSDEFKSLDGRLDTLNNFLLKRVSLTEELDKQTVKLLEETEKWLEENKSDD